MIEWTEQATEQLEAAQEYISLSNGEDVATRVVSRIISNILQLESFPISGRPGRVPGTRELVVAQTPFIAVYAIEKSRIVVLAIYHGAQRWPESF